MIADFLVPGFLRRCRFEREQIAVLFLIFTVLSSCSQNLYASFDYVNSGLWSYNTYNASYGRYVDSASHRYARGEVPVAVEIEDMLSFDVGDHSGQSRFRQQYNRAEDEYRIKVTLSSSQTHQFLGYKPGMIGNIVSYIRIDSGLFFEEVDRRIIVTAQCEASGGATTYVQAQVQGPPQPQMCNEARVFEKGDSYVTVNFYVEDRTLLPSDVIEKSKTASSSSLEVNVFQGVDLDDLVTLADESYKSFPGSVNGFSVIDSTLVVSDSGFHKFRAVAFERNEEIVIAFQGSSTTKDWLGNISFLAGAPSDLFREYVAEAASFTRRVIGNNPFKPVFVTGHSLGGGIAQIIGNHTGFNTVTFNAAGAAEVLPFLSAELASLSGIGELIDPDMPFGSYGIQNYRANGDVVSLALPHVGQTLTLTSKYGAPKNTNDLFLGALNRHDLEALAEAIEEEDQSVTFFIWNNMPDLAYQTEASNVRDTLYLGDVVQPGEIPIFGVLPKALRVFGTYVSDGIASFFDPEVSDGFLFQHGTGPLFSSVAMPTRPDGEQYEVLLWENDQWILDGLVDGLTEHVFDEAVSEFLIGNLGGLEFDTTVAQLTFNATGFFDGSITTVEIPTDQVDPALLLNVILPLLLE